MLGGGSYRQHETRAPGSNRRAQATPTLLTHRAPPTIITAATLVNGIGDPIELAGDGATW